jgi:hypothetical protein
MAHSYEKENFMSADSAALSLEKPKAFRVILIGGLIAGTLDILAAFIQSGLRGVTPMRVLQAIASGLLGADSFQGGFATAALGLARKNGPSISFGLRTKSTSWD